MDSLTYLTLIITYQCVSSCDHCCIGAGPHHREWMSIKDAEDSIAVITRINEIKWMTLIGGEALLDLDRTLAIGKIALSYGIKKVEIDTGSAWAVNDEITRRTLKRIFDAGLSLGAISVDGFHQAKVPKENVLRVLRAAREMGHNLKGSCAVIQDGISSNSMDKKSSEISHWFEEQGFQIESFPVVFQGKAVNLTAHHSGPRSIPEEKCEGVYFFATENWQKPGGIQIDVYGNVMLEHGICIGNKNMTGLTEILDEYDAESHPIISVLMMNGPLGLTQLPEAKDFKPLENGYVDKCHLCQDIRTYLRPYFPDILGPDSYYPLVIERNCKS